MTTRNRLIVFMLVFALAAIQSAAMAAPLFDELKGQGIKADGKPVKVALTAAELSAEYTVNIFEYAKRLLEISGAEVVSYANANWNPQTQMSQVEDFIQLGVDAIIIQPVDEAALVPVVDRARAAGISIIAVNRPVNTDMDLLIGIDNEGYGRAAAELLVEWADGREVKILEVQGEMHLEIAAGRSRGFMEVVNKHPNLKIVNQAPTLWRAEDAMASLIDTMSVNPDLKAVFSHSDLMVPGVVSGLRSLDRLYPVGHPNHVWIGSVDGAPVGVQGVNDGYHDVTLEQNSFIFGTLAAKGVIDRVAKGLPIGGVSVLVEPIFVTKENAGSPARYANFNLKANAGAWPHTEAVWNGIDFGAVAGQEVTFAPAF